MERSYQNAHKIIESRQRKARPLDGNVKAAKVEAQSSSGTPDLRGTPSIAGMKEWLQMLGHSDEDLNALNIIHIAGTKGKGSTCAFIESILRAHGERTGFPRKTGLYTSPHLMNPEERIRIDSKPIQPGLFAQYLFEVYDDLPQLATDYDPAKVLPERGPRYLQLLALLAFHAFIREGVDVAIVETHSGGEYDATNVITKPKVTAITTLGMDHIDMLGPTVENIAWHKSGIFKTGALAVSAAQEPGPMKVLQDRAKQKDIELGIVAGDHVWLPTLAPQMKPVVQKKNASLAITAVEEFLFSRRTEPPEMLNQHDVRRGVEKWFWPGRFQSIFDGQRAWFLDAAHNTMSVKLAAQWYAESLVESSGNATKALIYSHANELRNAEELLDALASELKHAGVRMDHVIFTTYNATNETLKTQTSGSFPNIWRRHFPHSRIWELATIKAAINQAKVLSSDGKEQILITGSQHLVGPALQLLKGDVLP